MYVRTVVHNSFVFFSNIKYENFMLTAQAQMTNFIENKTLNVQNSQSSPRLG